MTTRITCRGLDDNGSEESSTGGSSGSGSEGGYAASSSSNQHGVRSNSCSSPSSEESSEDSGNEQLTLTRGKSFLAGDPIRPMLSKKLEAAHSSSSEIADFSTTTSAVESIATEDFDERTESASISSTSNCSDSSDVDERIPNNFVSACLKRAGLPRSDYVSTLGELRESKTASRNQGGVNCIRRTTLAQKRGRNVTRETENPTKRFRPKPAILSLGCDVMAHVLTFLQPPDILDALTMPVSKDWISAYTRQPELWRVLCLLEPFNARVDDSNDDNEETDLLPFCNDNRRKDYFGKYRLLYTSFVRCMRYLVRIKEDALNGRPTSIFNIGTLDSRDHNISANRNLQNFLSQAREVMGAASTSAVPHLAEQVAKAAPVNLSDDESLTNSVSFSKKYGTVKDKGKRKVRYGHSKLTQRLLGPASNGKVRDVELPWSCGIYSIVNWMVAFADVEGIQTMCLKVLPFLLENEQQRITAQRAGLTDIVLRAMVLFPNSSHLHIAAFHTIVLLARPLGGHEGMLFHTSMVNSSGIFSSEGSQNGRSGIAVLLDSMRRFRTNKILQSMSCWSLVNIALAPAQKEVLVMLGGVEVTIQAMIEHPLDAEVQFRALFALINLVIPSVKTSDSTNTSIEVEEDEQSERESQQELVNQILHLVVTAMKNFCSNEAILNRACLVLHNLSLTEDFHESILWTPGCYQMLEWCLANYRTDQVLQQSAAGTLHRLQMSLSRSESLRVRFGASIRAQQQLLLERAHAEAVLLHSQHSQLGQEDPR